MKRQKIYAALLALVATMSLGSFAACGSEDHVHSYGEVHKGTAATCTEAGTSDYYECSCGKKFVKEGDEYVEKTDLTIAALGHDFENGTEVEGSRKAATCTAKGEYKVKCSRCEATETKELPLDANAHVFGEFVAEVPATCTEAGTKGHKACSACKKNFDKDGNEITDLTIAALGHDFENGTEVEGSRKAATCTAKGEYKVKCSRCDQTETKEIPMGAHSGGTATCTKKAVCETCGAEYGELADHTYGDIVPYKAATIDEEGNLEYKTCSVCKKNFDKDGNELANVVLVKLPSVTISFKEIERADIRIEKGTKTTIEEPVKEDYWFVNWTDDEGNEVDVTAAFNADITLNANFKEGYNFKKSHENATATTATESATAGNIEDSPLLETGIRYNLPTSEALYNITLPCINYSKFTVVAFNWKAEGWTQIGTNGDRNHGGKVVGGIFYVVKTSEDVYKTIFIDTTGGHTYYGEITDKYVLGGKKGLAVINANTLAVKRWFDIEVAGVSHVYDDGVLQRVAVSDDRTKFITNLQNVYAPNTNSGNWTVALQAIDYTKYESVTFDWKFSCAQARIGLNSVTDIVEKNTVDDNAMKGTLVISKNAEGKYVATLTNNSEDGGTITKVLSDDVANGTKGLVLYFGSDVGYRQLTLNATPTYKELSAE